MWDRSDPAWLAPQIQRVADILSARKLDAEDAVLDAGCGTGNYALALAQAGFRVLGVDYADGMLVAARKKITPELTGKLLFQKTDLNAPLDFPDGSFHHLINISVLQVTKNPGAVLREFRRVLKSCGTLVLLHVPESGTRRWPVWQTFRFRWARVQQKNPARAALILAKILGERTAKSHHWTASEFSALVAECGFSVISVDSDSPIILVAEKRR